MGNTAGKINEDIFTRLPNVQPETILNSSRFLKVSCCNFVFPLVCIAVAPSVSAPIDKESKL